MINTEKILKILNKNFNITKADVAIVVGSGLMDSIPELQRPVIVSYNDLKMPKSKVKGHSGKFIFGKLGSKTVVLVSRIHYYESGDIEKVRLPFEIVSKLGVKEIVLLTSCGGLNKTFKVGDIMLIKDHINFTGNNPLIGITPLEFTPMANCYDSALFNNILSIAQTFDIDLRTGVHIQFSGPSYETIAEVELSRMMGADTVSMSTAFDCIISNYYKMKVIALACIVNVFGNDSNELSHEEVLENAQRACKKIKTILSNYLET